jgi:hypothetical protein
MPGGAVASGVYCSATFGLSNPGIAALQFPTAGTYSVRNRQCYEHEQLGTVI